MAVIGGGERDLTIKLLADVDNFKKNMDKASGQTDSFANKSGAALKKVGVAVAAAAAAAGAFAVKFGVDAVKAASDLQETLSKTAQLFGENAAEVEKFAATAATKLGQSKQQALDAAANFAIFGKAAGLAGSDLVNFSTDFTVLASDLASFNNTSPEEAINAIGSALRGEAEPLRKYGVLLDDASLRQAALELGIVNTTKNALTPQQKVLAAQKLIFEQTTAAQGDFARTSDGLANGQRILAAQFENVKTTVGNALLPVVTQLFQVILNDVVPIFKTLADDFSKNLLPILDRVFKIIQRDLFPVFKVLGEFILKDLVPTIRDFFRPIVDILIDGIQFLISKVKENSEGFSVFLGIIDRVWQFIKTYVIPLFQTAFVTAINLVFRQIGTLIDAFSKVFEIIGKVAKFLGFDLSLELNTATKATTANAEATANAYRQFQEYSRTVQEEVLPATTEFVNVQNAVATSTAKATKEIERQTRASEALERIKKKLKDDPTGAKTVAAARAERSAAEIADILRTEINPFILTFDQLLARQNLTGAMTNITSSLIGTGVTNLTPQQAVAAGFGGLTVSELERVGLSPRGSANPITINVNGQVLDAEGVARAIQNVLQQSGNRAGELSLQPTGLGID